MDNIVNYINICYSRASTFVFNELTCKLFFDKNLTESISISSYIHDNYMHHVELHGFIHALYYFVQMNDKKSFMVLINKTEHIKKIVISFCYCINNDELTEELSSISAYIKSNVHLPTNNILILLFGMFDKKIILDPYLLKLKLETDDIYLMILYVISINDCIDILNTLSLKTHMFNYDRFCSLIKIYKNSEYYLPLINCYKNYCGSSNNYGIYKHLIHIGFLMENYDIISNVFNNPNYELLDAFLIEYKLWKKLSKCTHPKIIDYIFSVDQLSDYINSNINMMITYSIRYGNVCGLSKFIDYIKINEDECKILLELANKYDYIQTIEFLQRKIDFKRF